MSVVNIAVVNMSSKAHGVLCLLWFSISTRDTLKYLQCCQIYGFIRGFLKLTRNYGWMQARTPTCTDFYAIMVPEEALPLQCCQVYGGLSWTTEQHQPF